MNPKKLALVGLVSVISGVFAYKYVNSIRVPEAKTIVIEKQVKPLETVEVLVAARDIGLGDTVNETQVRWQEWPKSGVTPSFVARFNGQTPPTMNVVGSIARGSFVTGEPIVAAKLVTGAGAGFMSAVLPSGTRAVAIEISAESGAGGFILPNDRVDVLLTQRVPGAQGGVSSDTILRNIRVLAIDQKIQEQKNERTALGRTATLELTPAQAEQIAMSRQMGTISLALRPLVDSAKTTSEQPVLAGEDKDKEKQSGGTTLVRYGVQQQVTGR